MTTIFALALLISSAMGSDLPGISKTAPSHYTVKFELVLEDMETISGTKICHRDWKCPLIDDDDNFFKLSIDKYNGGQHLMIHCADHCSFSSGRNFQKIDDRNGFYIYEGADD